MIDRVKLPARPVAWPAGLALSGFALGYGSSDGTAATQSPTPGPGTAGADTSASSVAGAGVVALLNFDGNVRLVDVRSTVAQVLSAKPA